MKKLIQLFLFLSFLIFLFFSLFSFNEITGIAMEPSFKNGTNALFWKWAHNPKRGDIVLYTTKHQIKPDNPNVVIIDYIGRVVGLPTESVRIEKGNLYIDNNIAQYRIEEKYLIPDTKTKAFEEGKWFQIGESEYLILTDKRESIINIPLSILHKDNIKGTLLYTF